jgi:hypothetical protein
MNATILSNLTADQLITHLEGLLSTYRASKETLSYEQRKGLYADIHRYARTCNLEGDAYRTVLNAVTGKSSCKDCTDDELRKASRFFSHLDATLNPVSDDELLGILG